jgi:hypothetical protein
MNSLRSLSQVLNIYMLRSSILNVYPHRMRAHLTKADMQLFQDYINKRVLPFHRWVKTIVIRCRTLYFLIFAWNTSTVRKNLTNKCSPQNAGNGISGFKFQTSSSRVLMRPIWKTSTPSNKWGQIRPCYLSPIMWLFCNKFIISNTMIWGKLVIKCPRKPREVCGIPEGAARGNSTNLPRVRDI